MVQKMRKRFSTRPEPGFVGMAFLMEINAVLDATVWPAIEEVQQNFQERRVTFEQARIALQIAARQADALAICELPDEMVSVFVTGGAIPIKKEVAIPKSELHTYRVLPKDTDPIDVTSTVLNISRRTWKVYRHPLAASIVRKYWTGYINASVCPRNPEEMQKMQAHPELWKKRSNSGNLGVWELR